MSTKFDIVFLEEGNLEEVSANTGISVLDLQEALFSAEERFEAVYVGLDGELMTIKSPMCNGIGKRHPKCKEPAGDHNRHSVYANARAS